MEPGDSSPGEAWPGRCCSVLPAKRCSRVTPDWASRDPTRFPSTRATAPASSCSRSASPTIAGGIRTAQAIFGVDDTPRFRLLSFLHKQESPAPAVPWIPACAGMTDRGAASQRILTDGGRGGRGTFLSKTRLHWSYFSNRPRGEHYEAHVMEVQHPPRGDE